MVSVLHYERSGSKSWPGSLGCVLGQDTLLSQCFSTRARFSKVGWRYPLDK